MFVCFKKAMHLKDMKITDHPSECGRICNTHQCRVSEDRKLFLEPERVVAFRVHLGAELPLVWSTPLAVPFYCTALSADCLRLRLTFKMTSSKFLLIR